MTQKFLFTLFVLLFIGSSKALGCLCAGTTDDRSVQNKWIGRINQSAAVFSGKVIGFEYRKDIKVDHGEERRLKDPNFSYETKVTKFQVDRWWKSGPAPTIYLYSTETKSSDGTSTTSSCDYRFTQDVSYLVFADKNGAGFRANSCSPPIPTKVDWYDQLLEIIGPGFPPNIKDQ